MPLFFSGKTRSVRRSLFAQSSGLGSGVYWEWANDEGGWTPYETRTSILLEHSYQARQGTADLGPHGYNYIVDLTSLAQVNKSTGFRRQVRRQCNLPYPLASSGPPAIPSGPACSCQQCLSHSSTGPMPSRSRHSFSSGSLNRPSLQGTGRAVAAHPTSVYSPYPRRPLSVGGMSWGSPWAPPTSGSQLSAPLTNSTSANGLRLVSDTYPRLRDLDRCAGFMLQGPLSAFLLFLFVFPASVSVDLSCKTGKAEKKNRSVAPVLHWYVCFGSLPVTLVCVITDLPSFCSS